MEREYVCSITPTEYEKYCLEILKGYAERFSVMRRKMIRGKQKAPDTLKAHRHR